MEKINNFDKFLNIKLEENEFIFIEIIRRKKDNPQLHKNSSFIKTFCIDKTEILSDIKDNIIELCDKLNAVAYVYYTPRNYKNIQINMLNAISNNFMINSNFKQMKKLFNSLSSKNPVKEKITWLVNINTSYIKSINNITDFINNECQPIGNDKIVDVIKTYNGYDLITKPFNFEKFTNYFNDGDITVFKNAPTLLYSFK